MYNTSKYFSYIYADRNVRPCTIQGYTLATFPKVTQYILCTTREETGKRTLHIFVQTFHIGNIIRLYRAAHECGHFQVPVPKTQDYNHVKDQHRPLSVPLPKDEYLEEA